MGHESTQSKGGYAEQAARVLAELNEWRRLTGLEHEKVLDVYIDFKSPHAYLAVRPSLEIARDYRVKVNFLPFTLSYMDMGLTTSVDADMKRRAPNPPADRKARMYYATARQYAALQGLPLRGPHRLLDSSLANRFFMFAKRQGLEVPFYMKVCLPGWGSGWRDYELESGAQLEASLRDVGADVNGLETFVAANGECQSEVDACRKSAEATGVAGVPHYVYFDVTLERELGLFGREHLALIRKKFSAEGLARHAGVRAQFSHAWHGPS
ncbi:MAG: DsbA family protein [Hyphomicrobiaceae bacterium]